MNVPNFLRHTSVQLVMLPLHLLIVVAGFYSTAFGQEGAPPSHAKDLVQTTIERTVLIRLTPNRTRCGGS